MNLRNIKPFFLVTLLAGGWQGASAQFDDVYYRPNDPIPGETALADSRADNADDGVRYYDNEAYPYYGDEGNGYRYGYGEDDYDAYYYDDYDYIYSSRIRRFYRPFAEVDFFSPVYTSFSWYDPFAWDAYYYPGASIYVNFGYGFNDYWAWRRWNRWNRWNQFSGWNSWWIYPSPFYYGYNAWCPPSYNYWSFGPNYHIYSNYYNNYYNYCPLPVSQYNGITHTTINVIGNGNPRGSYYGPRTTGNTGTSPRGPVNRPGQTVPMDKDKEAGVTASNDGPRGLPTGEKPGIVQPNEPPRQASTNPDVTNDPVRQETTGVRQVPADRELPRTTDTGQRPVYKPESDRYQPRPYTPREPAARPDGGSPEATPRTTDRPADRPAPQYTPRPRYSPPTGQKPTGNDTPSRQYQPSGSDRPSYQAPSSRENRNQEPPAYRPTPRDDSRSSTPSRSYEPPARSSSPSRSYDRPSSPSSSRPSGGSSGSSGSSNRSSGGGGSSPSRTSPRGGG